MRLSLEIVLICTSVLAKDVALFKIRIYHFFSFQRTLDLVHFGPISSCCCLVILSSLCILYVFMSASYVDLSFVGMNVCRDQETRKGLRSGANRGCEGEWGA